MYVLVCYAGTHSGTNWDVIETLDSAGHETWLDQWAMQAADWQEHVASIVERSKLLLYVLEPDTVADPRRAWIVERVIAAGVPVVVLRYDPALTIPAEIRDSAILDFTGTVTPRMISDLLDVIRRESRSHITLQPTTGAPRMGTFSGHQRATGIVIFTLMALAITLLLEGLLGPLALDIGPGAPLISRLFVAVYQAGPLVFFLGGALLFSVVTSSSLWSLLVLLAVQTSLGLGYLLSPDRAGAHLLVMAGGSLIGYFVGQSRVMLWPWRSFQLDQACRRYQDCVARGGDVAACAVPVIRLLDKPMILPAAGAAAGMQMLADDGLTVMQFATHAQHPGVQEEYQHFVHQISLEKLEQVEHFEEALATIQAYQILPDDMQAQAQMFLHKRDHATTMIEVLRAHGQFLWYLQQKRETLETEAKTQSTSALKAIHLLVRLTHDSIDYQDVANYWILYRGLEAHVQQIHMASQSTANGAASTPRVRIREAITCLTDTLRILQGLEKDMLHRFPAREQKWQVELATVNVDLSQLLATEYQERQEILSREIARLDQIHHSQPASWLAIDQLHTEVVEQSNPWCLLTLQLLQQLERIQKLDQGYVIWAEGQLSQMLNELETLQHVAHLEQELAKLEISGDSFGPMVDGMMRSLMEISAEAQSAIDWPEGTYQYRQSLINAQQKLEDLRIWLQSRFNRARPRQWAEQVRGVALILEQYLNQQRLIDTSRYMNPYMTGNPIQPKRAALFKGRMELAEQIMEWLRSDNRPTLVLHGPRRMGKTSFLLQLQNLMSGWHDSPISIFWDGQYSGSYQNDASFFHTLARVIHTQVKRRGIQISCPSRHDFETYPYETLTPWLEDVVFPAIGEDMRLLVTIDEFEKIGDAIRKGQLTVHVLDFLRHTVQHNENMLFLFCGVQTLESLGPNAASYFIGVQTIEIGYLDRPAAEALICNPTEEDHGLPEYNANVVREIITLTHGQPFLIQAICSQIIQRANKRQLASITLPTLRDVVPDVFESGRMYFLNIWHDAGQEGRSLLASMAEGPVPLTPQQANSSVVRGLVERRVICRVAGDAQLLYEIEIPLVQEWVARQVVTTNKPPRARTQT